MELDIRRPSRTFRPMKKFLSISLLALLGVAYFAAYPALACPG